MTSLQDMERDYARVSSQNHDAFIASLDDLSARVSLKDHETRATTSKSLALLSSERSETANLLDVFGLKEDEITLSNVLAWLFNPSQPHGLKGTLLLDFLNAAWVKRNETEDVSGLDMDEIQVKREVVGDESRSDILITDSNHTFVCVIENKIHTEETENGSKSQTVRLYDNFRDARAQMGV